MSMADRELDKIKKLPPKERLKRIKELEERRKKEESETKRIIKESLDEIKLDEMLQEIEVPEQEKVDVNKLFIKESEPIEDQVKAEQIKIEEISQSDYGQRIQELLPQNTMHEIKDWYAQDNQPPRKDEFLEVYRHAREAYETLQKSMQKGPDPQMYSSPSEELVENVVSSMKILRSMGYKHDFFGPGG